MQNMKANDVVLTPLPQADGQLKLRPAIVLCFMPPFNDVLLCGISSKLNHFVNDFDEIIFEKENDFKQSGLSQPSLIRLGFLSVLPRKNIAGTIGSISKQRHQRLIINLIQHLNKNSKL